MKEKVIIKRIDEVLYQGKILDLPIKEKNIIEKSIEIFGDEDPCVVHMSFVVKELVTEILDLFEDNNTNLLNVKDYLDQLSFINFEDLSKVTIELVRRRK
jgi:hypothetical protein